MQNFLGIVDQLSESQFVNHRVKVPQAYYMLELG